MIPLLSAYQLEGGSEGFRMSKNDNWTLGLIDSAWFGSCKVADYLRIWAAPRKLSANGSTLFANEGSQSVMSILNFTKSVHPNSLVRADFPKTGKRRA
jgi:hypothetical protein